MTATQPPPAPLDVSSVLDAMRQLDKTIRARQLYPVSNPTYRRAFDQLRDAFADIGKRAPSLTVKVTETTLRWRGAAVLEEADKSGNSLPWTLFKDGVRELTFQPGFENEELDWFLEIIPKARRAQEAEEDLLTLLWEQEFALLNYRYVEPVHDTGAPLELAMVPGHWPSAPAAAGVLDAITDFTTSALGTAAAAALERLLADEASTELVERAAATLDRAEIAQLQADTAEEYRLDIREETIGILVEVFATKQGEILRGDVARQFHTMLQSLLLCRHYHAAARLMREAAELRATVPDIPPDVAARLDALPGLVSDPAVFAGLAAALEEELGDDAHAAIRALFAHLVPGALEMVLAAVEPAVADRLRSALVASAERLGAADPERLAPLIQSREAGVARTAAVCAGTLKLEAAVPSLTRMVGGTDALSRTVALQALVAVGSPAALRGIERVLTDADRDLRVAALRALSERPYAALLPRLSPLIASPEMRQMDHRERRALFDLYGVVAGESGVPVLEGLLAAKSGLFGRQEDSDVRACAAMALGRIGTPGALEVLTRTANDKDPVVKRSVALALDRQGA